MGLRFGIGMDGRFLMLLLGRRRLVDLCCGLECFASFDWEYGKGSLTETGSTTTLIRTETLAQNRSCKCRPRALLIMARTGSNEMCCRRTTDQSRIENSQISWALGFFGPSFYEVPDPTLKQFVRPIPTLRKYLSMLTQS